MAYTSYFGAIGSTSSCREPDAADTQSQGGLPPTENARIKILNEQDCAVHRASSQYNPHNTLTGPHDGSSASRMAVYISRDEGER